MCRFHKSASEVVAWPYGLQWGFHSVCARHFLNEQVCACSQRGRQNTSSPHNVTHFIEKRYAARFIFTAHGAPHVILRSAQIWRPERLPGSPVPKTATGHSNTYSIILSSLHPGCLAPGELSKIKRNWRTRWKEKGRWMYQHEWKLLHTWHFWTACT